LQEVEKTSSVQKDPDKVVLLRKRFLFPTYDHVPNNQIFAAIAQICLAVSPNKCYITELPLLFLGHKISTPGITTPKAEVDGIYDINSPKNVPTLQTLPGILPQFPPLKVQYLNKAKLNEKLEKTHEFKPAIATPAISLANSKQRDNMAGGAMGAIGNTWAKKFKNLVLHIEKSIAYWFRIWKPTAVKCPLHECKPQAIKFGEVEIQPYLSGLEFSALISHVALAWSTFFKNMEGRPLLWDTVSDANHGMKIVPRVGSIQFLAKVFCRFRELLKLQLEQLSKESSFPCFNNQSTKGNEHPKYFPRNPGLKLLQILSNSRIELSFL
jgi:hypothetical protein